MAKITEALGSLTDEYKTSGVFDDDLIPTLLWQVSNHYDLLSGLIRISREADFRLNNPDKVFPRRQENVL